MTTAMQKGFIHTAIALAATLLVAACGTGKSGSATTAGRAGVHSAEKVPGPVPQDTADYNTKLRLRYFYAEAASQQALGNYDVAYELLRHCREIDPCAAEVYYGLSAYDKDLNSTATAIADIKKAAELSPQNSTYQEQLAMTYVTTKDYGNAIKAYEKLYSAHPDRTEVLEILFSLYSQNKDYPKMLNTVDRKESADGESEKTVLTKMRIYTLQDKKKEAYGVLRRFVDRYPNDLSYQIMMSNWLLGNGEKQKAYEILQSVEKTDPQNVQAKLSLVDYYRAENLDSIANRIEEEVLENPRTDAATKVSVIRNVISRSENSGGDSTAVLSLFRRLLSVEQENSDIAELEVAYMSLKKMPEDSIVAGLRRVLSIAPDNKGARLELLRTLWGKIDSDGIIGISLPGVEYNPDEMAFYYFLGFAYIQKGDDNNALDILRKGVAQATDTSEPSVVSDMYAYIGDILHQKGEADAAYAAYDSCLQWREDNAPCLNNYAYFISEEGGDLSRAEQMSYKTIKAEPTNSTYLDTYAWILYNEKRYAEAQIYIEQAIANDSTNSAVLLEHGGDIYIMLGQKEKAVELWRKAIEAGGDAKALERKIRMRKAVPLK